MNIQIQQPFTQIVVGITRKSDLLYTKDISLDGKLQGNNQIFTIGRSPENDFQFPSDSLSQIHFGIDYSPLISNQLEGINLDQNIINNVYQFAAHEKQKIKIKDISNIQGTPNLIKIKKKQCENQTLIKESTFVLGQECKIKVVQNQQMFGDFLEKPDLFKFAQKAKVLGLPQGMQNIFDQMFKQRISGNQFNDALKSNELEAEVRASQLKSCIYLRTKSDSSRDSWRYLLVENDINQFRVGRAEFSDIKFEPKSVSLRHATIRYINNNWIINDGQRIQDEDTQIEGSKYKTWLEMEHGKSYYLDNNQAIKVQDLLIEIKYG